MLKILRERFGHKQIIGLRPLGGRAPVAPPPGSASGLDLSPLAMTITIGLFAMQGLRPIIQTYKHHSVVVTYMYEYIKV